MNRPVGDGSIAPLKSAIAGHVDLSMIHPEHESGFGQPGADVSNHFFADQSFRKVAGHHRSAEARTNRPSRALCRPQVVLLREECRVDSDIPSLAGRSAPGLLQPSRPDYCRSAGGRLVGSTRAPPSTSGLARGSDRWLRLANAGGLIATAARRAPSRCIPRHPTFSTSKQLAAPFTFSSISAKTLEGFPPNTEGWENRC